MYEKSWTLILAPTLFLALFLSPCFAGIICDASLYGNPSPNECSQILWAIGSKDQMRHLFYIGNLEEQPSDVTLAEWDNRIDVGGVKVDRDGCSVFMEPGYDTQQRLWYDTGTYASLAQQATQVQNYCSRFTAPDYQASSMEGGQGWIGDKGRLLVVIYTNTSKFATKFAESIAHGFLPDLTEITARNPPKFSPPKNPPPVCGRTHFCSKASHCRGHFSCMCVADRWHGEFYTSSCVQPIPSLGSGRGLTELDSPNATQSIDSINVTLTGEGSTGPACPCNCTYVSKACCTSPSGIVYEAPDLRLGALQAPSVNLTCNAMTGDFQASNLALDVTLTPRAVGLDDEEPEEPQWPTNPTSKL